MRRWNLVVSGCSPVSVFLVVCNYPSNRTAYSASSGEPNPVISSGAYTAPAGGDVEDQLQVQNTGNLSQ